MLARVTGAVVLALALAGRLGAQQVGGLNVNWGAHVAYPEYVSGSIGLNTSSVASQAGKVGYFVRLEPGYYGGRLTFGQWRGVDNGFFSSHLGVMQTWNGGPGMGRGATYVGFEQRVTIAAFEAGLGFYFKSSSSATTFGVVNPDTGPGNMITFVLGANFFR